MKLHLSHTQIIVLGFLIMIIIGTLLLCLPIATNDRNGASFLTALFTATSASCVTGLIVKDTAIYWSTFGKIVVIILIQIGGLGFMTISTMFFLLMRSKIGLRQREVLVESINASTVGGVLKLTKLILIGTAIVELSGAVLLSIRFIPLFGPIKGFLYGLFHSISAFCNAGFDLMGELKPYSSFSSFSNDWLINLTLIILITLGGLGFVVWDNLLKNGFRVKRYSFQTRLVLLTSGIMLLSGAIVLMLFERNNTMSDMPLKEKILASFFASATARTAGFNTIDVAAMSEGGKFITILLMFVGGSPGSTAGGAKTTTLAVLIATAASSVLQKRQPNVLGRRINSDIIQKALSVVVFNFVIGITGTILLCYFQDFSFLDALFECISAIGTVGMTTGITRNLNTVSSLIIVIIMFTGRVGSVSFAMAIMEKKATPSITFPSEKLMIG